jgi:hypothetical protein
MLVPAIPPAGTNYEGRPPAQSRLAGAEYAAFVLEVHCRGAVLSPAALEIATTPLGSTCARLTDPVLCFDETPADAGDLMRLLRAHGFESR